MVSPVKSPLTHYENLNLTPAATPDEIAEAFAKQIRITITSPEEAVEHANRIYVAYETLRDPISRRAYDAAIGLWDPEAAGEPKVEPFFGAKARESPELGLYDASPGDPAGPAKNDRRQARRANKAAVDRKAAAAEQRKSAAGPGPTNSLTEEVALLRKLRSLRVPQTRAVPANHRTPTGRNSSAARAGVMIVAFGVLITVVGLVKGNSDQTTEAPSREIAVTDKQASVHTRARATAAREQALPVDQTQSEARGEGSSSDSAGEPDQQLRDRPQLHQQATGTQFEQYASRKAAATPSQQSDTRRTAGTPPQQGANRQSAPTPPQQLANRQSVRTPPQQVLYRQTLPATQSKATTREDASGKVASSAIGEKICKQLPLSWSRLPQRACLTMMEWKQVEEELR